MTNLTEKYFDFMDRRKLCCVFGEGWSTLSHSFGSNWWILENALTRISSNLVTRLKIMGVTFEQKFWNLNHESGIGSPFTCLMFWILSLNVTFFKRGRNLTQKCISEFLPWSYWIPWNMIQPFVASPIREKGNKRIRTGFLEWCFLKENRPHTCTTFRILLSRSLVTRPLNRLFICRIYNVVLLTSNTILPKSKSNRIAAILPKWSSFTLCKLVM